MKALTPSLMRSVLGPLADASSQWDTDQLTCLVNALQTHSLRCVRPRPSANGLALPPAELPFDTMPVPWSPIGRFVCDSKIRPGGYLHFVAGDYAIQDAASLLPIALMEIQPGQTLCDLCAAPGGKSTAMLEGLAGTGLLMANEVIASRVDTLQLAMARTGFANYFITNQPVDRLVDGLSASQPEAFDCVLVDAPCTGQSMLARGKQTLSAFSDKQIAHSAARQQSILRSALELVKPGGRLVYSTCTFAFEENEAVVEWLRQQLPDWQPLIVEALEPWQSIGYPGCYRLWPHRDRCNGGFAAALVRPGLGDPRPTGDRALDREHGLHLRKGHSAWKSPWRQTSIVELEEFVGTQPIWVGHLAAHWYPERLSEAWLQLSHAGLQVAQSFGQRWQPAHPLGTLAWQPVCESMGLSGIASVELSDSEAIQFMSGASLHRSSMPAPEVGANAGWFRATWRGRPLAWVKQAGGQIKNHLPKPLRTQLNPAPA